MYFERNGKSRSAEPKGGSETLKTWDLARFN